MADLSALTNLIATLPAAEVVAEREGHIEVAGLPRSAQPAWIAAVAEKRSRICLVSVPHLQEAQDLAEQLPFWTDRRVQLFPAIESLPYERVRVDRSLLAARERVASDVFAGEAEIVVCSARSLLQPLDRATISTAGQRAIRVGDVIQPARLLMEWTQGGYSQTSPVVEPGSFAQRGGLLDVFPVSSSAPARIEFFGDTIESIRLFDPVSQRSMASIEEITVQPMAKLDEGLRVWALEQLRNVDTSSLSAEVKTGWLHDLDLLEAGGGLEDLAVFTPYLQEQPISLVEMLSDTGTVGLANAQEFWETLRGLSAHAADLQGGMEDSGNLPPGLKSPLLPVEDVSESIRKHRHVELLRGSPQSPQAIDLTGLFAMPPSYGGRLRALIQDLRSAANRTTVIATVQDQRLHELLDEEDIATRRSLASLDEGIHVLRASIGEGWQVQSENLLLLSDYELFGHSRSRPLRRPPPRPREASFAPYSPGDYVVHLEHGVGQFESIERMTVEGAVREYAVVRYAGTDRVYVPTDQLERLTRYVGMGDAPPTLNRLGGGEWRRARQRATQAAEDMAQDLVDLYSKRMARPGHPFAADSPWQAELESSFPFLDTPDQVRAVTDVKADMEQPRPMDRLVTADVGYGKTEVAVRAAFKAVMDGRQVALLAPTTILAQQHFETFSERFEAFPVKIEVLSRFRSPKQQREILRQAVSGEIEVLIGTHRLLQRDVAFKNLGLVIVDEEQRFGVKHKEQLKKMRETVDVLTLTATPIPRTLHMTLVGIREVSVIETPPEGRLPIKTYLQPFDERLIREATLRELERDGQVYLVHNKVATIDAMAERIRRLVPEARVVVSHGQMEESQLEKVMLGFARQKADVLVCSTIIENGLDIPNVNTIVVNNAHRLGLTQLYQLRGRVGRSVNQAYAYLLYPADVRLSNDAARRLEAVFEAQQLGAGFTIAMRDLEIRGAGNLLGAEQSGHVAAIGFDLYTRMVGDAVQRLRGVAMEEPQSVSLNLPVTAYLPREYVGDEDERLTLYRRLASTVNQSELQGFKDELQDRFGPLPLEAENLMTLVGLKILAASVRVTSISVDQYHLTIRGDASVIYDRVSLYRSYGSDAHISTNVLRIPRGRLSDDCIEETTAVLEDMSHLRETIEQEQPLATA